MRTHLNKIFQIDLKRALVEKCWLAVSIVTHKRGPILGLGFSWLRFRHCFFLIYR